MGVFWGAQKWWLKKQETGGIVTDGLVLNFDAGNPYSYSGSGTTWYDLSDNNNNGTLINGVSYNSSNLGSLVFNGTNQYGTIRYNSKFHLSADYALEAWFKSSSFSNPFALISKDTYGENYDWGIVINSNTDITIYSSATAYYISATVPELQQDTWYNVIITQISGVTKIYLNAVEYASGNLSLSNDSRSYVTLGCVGWNNPTWFIQGDISVLRVYKNKGLTQQEVTQNYNALKGRYGL